jgi:hypothetical protein
MTYQVSLLQEAAKVLLVIQNSTPAKIISCFENVFSKTLYTYAEYGAQLLALSTGLRSTPFLRRHLSANFNFLRIHLSIFCIVRQILYVTFR